MQPIYQIPQRFSSAPSEAPLNFEGKALSATEAIVCWHPLTQSQIDGYQVSSNLSEHVMELPKCYFLRHFISSLSSCVPGEVLEE